MTLSQAKSIGEAGGLFSFGAIHHMAAEHYAPPSVLVNDNYDIVHMSERAGRFVQLTGSEPPPNLLHTVLPALQINLRGALLTAKQEDRQVEFCDVQVALDGSESRINVIVSPVDIPDSQDRYFLVVFEGERKSAREEELRSINEKLTAVNHELKEKIDEVRSVNGDLVTLMRSTDIGTILLDCDLRIKRYTRSIENLFEIADSDIGRPIIQVTRQVDYDEIVQDATEVLRNPQTIEHEVRKTYGAEYYLVRLAPCHAADGRIDGVIVSFIDITSLKHATNSLREREMQLRMAQQEAKTGIWVLNLKDGSAVWSDECFRMRGMEPVSMEMTARNWIHRLHPEESHRVEEAIARAVRERCEYNFETKISLPSGETRWLMEVGQAVHDDAGVAERIAGITLDVTERVKLRRELAEQAIMTRESQHALERADRRKDEFLATLAHELRNPLAPICNGLELVRGAANPQEKTRALEIIERQVAKIVHLVDDLLDVSRITQGKIQLRKQTIALADVVKSAVHACQPIVAQRRHTLEVKVPDEPIHIEADHMRISQVILNLLTNAAKYTDDGGKILLSVETTGSEASISVKDSGIGLAPDMIPHIFDVFAQVTQFKGNPQSGLGVGLSIVKKLIELHGGSVQARSDGLGKGTKFIINLPLAKPGESPAPVPPAPAPLTPPPAAIVSAARILIVDDNVDAGEMLRHLLSVDQHTLQVARDGESGIEMAMEFQPHIVLLDIGLPDISGYEVATTLRHRLPSTKLVAVSGWGQKEDLVRSSEAGFDFHLVKPTTIEQIREVVARFLPKEV